MTLPANLRVLFDEATIAARVTALAAEIAARIATLEHPPQDLTAVVILRGSFVFAADLLRALHRAGLGLSVEFMQLASYHEGRESSGTVTLTKDIEGDVAGRHVLLIDDILETGRTLAHARALLMARGAREVLTCVLVEKPGKRAVPFDAECVGFSVPDRFVVGYGMDLAHKYRELPFIGEMVEQG